MNSLAKRLSLALALGAALIGVAGCGENQAPAPMDPVMTSSPSGLWVGDTDSSVELEIQEGGFFKLHRSNQEQLGSWKSSGEGQIEATLDGRSYTLPFTRSGLELSITLPGDSSPSKFTQM
jgi:hypothetical protein